MSKSRIAFSVVCLLVGLNHTMFAEASVPVPSNPGAVVAQQTPVNWVSVTEIENSLLGREPVVVGFDVDDTVLFSSAGFLRGQKALSPGQQDYLMNPDFWEKMNNGWDEFSTPKEVAKKLIALHLHRGDSIWFITERSQTKTETITKTLQDSFLIPQADMNPVIFAGDKEGQNSKVQWLKDKHIKIYYGDSDSDIAAAQEMGARGIRVLRASNSSDRSPLKIGSFGEEVIIESDY